MRNIALLVLLVLIVSVSYSQGEDWVSYTHGHEVVDVATDSNILWIATSGGLVRIDNSLQDTVFFTKSNTDLETYLINAIEIDDQHNLWVGTDGKGLYLFDGTSWVKNPFGVPLPNNYISEIEKDNNGDIWVGCRFYLEDGSPYPTPHPGGLIKFDGTDWTDHSDKLFNSGKTVHKVGIDYNGRIIIAAEELIIFDGDEWIYPNQPPLGTDFLNVTNLAVDTLGQVWLLKNSATIVMWDDTDWHEYPLGIDISSSFYNRYSITIDPLNTIYIGSYVNNDIGLIMYDGGDWSNYTSENSGLGTNRIRSLDKDRDHVFIGTYGNGLDLLNGIHEFTNINTSNSILMNNWTVTLYIDSSEILYTSIYNYLEDSSGLVTYDGLSWENKSSLPFSGASSILEDQDGRLWVASWQGVAVLADTGWIVYDTSNTSLPNHAVNSMDLDSEGNLWIVGGDGFSCFMAVFDGELWSTIDLPTNAYSFYKILVDTENNKWIGSYRGLFLYDENWQWTTYTNFGGLGVTNNHVFDLEQAGNSNKLWMATSSGLYQKDADTFINVYAGRIEALGVDANFNVWSACWDSLNIHSETGQFINSFTPWNSGLPFSPLIREIEITSEGIVFMGSGNGIVKYIKGNEIYINEWVPGEQVDILLFPNPNTGYLTIKSDDLTSISDGKVFTTDGRLVYQFSINNFSGSANLDISFLPPGIYLMNIDGKTSKMLVITP
jgi:streptogramin lyase